MEYGIIILIYFSYYAQLYAATILATTTSVDDLNISNSREAYKLIGAADSVA